MLCHARSQQIQHLDTMGIILQICGLFSRSNSECIDAEDASKDVAIFCLALMGMDYPAFLAEAHRVLRPRGMLWIAEVCLACCLTASLEAAEAVDQPHALTWSPCAVIADWLPCLVPCLVEHLGAMNCMLN